MGVSVDSSQGNNDGLGCAKVFSEGAAEGQAQNQSQNQSENLLQGVFLLEKLSSSGICRKDSLGA